MELRWAALPGCYREVTKTGTMSRPPSVTLQERAVFWSALETLFSAGIALDRSLLILSGQFPNRPLARICQQVSDLIRRGQGLPQAMAASGGFSPFALAIVDAGCQTGALSLLLSRLSEHEQKRYRLDARLKAALYYPAFTMAVAFLFLLVVPPLLLGGLFELLERLGTSPPLPTRLMAMVAKAAGHPLFYVVLGGTCAAAWHLGRQAMARPRWQARVEAFVLRVPILRDAWTALILCRFAESLSVALDTGMRVDKAAELAIRASGSRLLALRRAELVDALLEGEGLARALQRVQLVPALFVQAVVVGEESGYLPRMLRSMAHLYEQDFEHRAERLTVLLEPLFLAGVGMIVGLLAVTAIGPLAQALSAL